MNGGSTDAGRSSADAVGVSLVRSGPVPLYAQVAERLANEITSGLLPPGSTIGTEPELMERFDVSRVTLRHAVDILVDRGLAARKQGKGTFVTSTPLSYPLETLQGTTQVAQAAGRPLHSEVHSFRTLRGTATVRGGLALSDNSKVTECLRIDHSAGGPVAVAIISLPDYIGQKLTKKDLATQALYPLLESKAGVHVVVAHQSMQAEAADERIAKFLHTDPGAPVMAVSRIARDREGTPVEFSTTYFNAEAVRFTLSLHRGSDGDITTPVQFAQIHPT